jgi:hypothetical protein
MTVLASSQQHQLMSDRSALVTRADAVPQLQQAADLGTSGLYGFYLKLQGEVTGQAYSNVFLICAWLSVLGLGLAFMMKKPEPHPDADQPAAPEAPPTSAATTDRPGAPSVPDSESDSGRDLGSDGRSDPAGPEELTRELTGGPARAGGR